MRLPTLTLCLLTLASPALAQDDYVVHCQVYRLDAAAREQLLANGATPTAASVRAKGRLRFEASLPCREGEQGQLNRSRKIPYLTQTTTDAATSSSVNFMAVNDSLSCTLRLEQGSIELGLHLRLSDVATTGAAGLPVVSERSFSTSVTLRVEGEWLALEGGRPTGDLDEALQVVVVWVTRAS